MLRKFTNAIKAHRIQRNTPYVLENNNRLVEMFTDYNINENNDDKRKLVLRALKDNDWEKPNGSNYLKALNKSIHKEMLTSYKVSELNQMKLFKLNGFDIGFALKKKDGKHNEIVAVFNNESDVKGIGKILIQSAIDNGGCFLDHYDGFLTKLYSSMGFVEYDRWAFDAQYDKDGSFRKKYGEADVIFRKHKSCS